MEREVGGEGVSEVAMQSDGCSAEYAQSPIDSIESIGL